MLKRLHNLKAQSLKKNYVRPFENIGQDLAIPSCGAPDSLVPVSTRVDVESPASNNSGVANSKPAALQAEPLTKSHQQESLAEADNASNDIPPIKPFRLVGSKPKNMPAIEPFKAVASMPKNSLELLKPVCSTPNESVELHNAPSKRRKFTTSDSGDETSDSVLPANKKLRPSNGDHEDLSDDGESSDILQRLEDELGNPFSDLGPIERLSRSGSQVAIQSPNTVTSNKKDITGIYFFCLFLTRKISTVFMSVYLLLTY